MAEVCALRVLCNVLYSHVRFAIACTFRSLKLFEVQSSSDNVDFSGDFRLCSPEDNDEDCDVISGSGEVDTTATPRSIDMDGDSAASSTSERHRVVYVERTSTQPRVTSDREVHSSTSAESLVIVVEMTERSPSRHAGHPLNPTLPPPDSSTAGRPPPYRLITTTPASPGVAAVGDGGGSAAAERVAINVGLIVGIVGAVSTLLVMLAALLLCRPRPHVAQMTSSADVDVVNDHHKLKLSNGERSVHGARQNVVVHANTVGLLNNQSRFEATAGRLSTADEWFV